jgi:transposase-like protein
MGGDSMKPKINVICPNCNSDVEMYDTAKDGYSGRYKCHTCGRDTVWKQIQLHSLEESFKLMKERLGLDIHTPTTGEG